MEEFGRTWNIGHKQPQEMSRPAAGAIAHQRPRKPVVIAARLYKSFKSKEARKTGLIPVPNPATEKSTGGHAMIAVGYDNARQVIIVRNSWGTDWGDGGYCYIPYAYFKAKDAAGRALIRGGWTIR